MDSNDLIKNLFLLNLVAFTSYLIPNVYFPNFALIKKVSYSEFGFMLSLFPIGGILTS